MINKNTAFSLAHSFARVITEANAVRAKLRHAADMQSHNDQPAVDRFTREHFEEFYDDHLTWVQANG